MTDPKEDFLEILADYQGILHRVNLVYFRSESDRKDNFQEIVYQLWKSYSNLRNRESIGSWIYAVSINTSISKLKKDKRIEYRDNLPELTDGSNVAEEYSGSESLKMLLTAIHQLEEVDKLLMLLYLEEKTYEEMSEIMGITKSNVGARINRAKNKLKKQFKSFGHAKR